MLDAWPLPTRPVRALPRTGAATILAACALGLSASPAPAATGGDLATYGTGGTADTGHPMYAGTSPSIADMSGGGYEIAYSSPDARFGVAGSVANAIEPLGMMAGSSPAIARQPGNGWEAAFEANTTSLWTMGTAGEKNWRLGMRSGTSPAIGELANGGYQAAFEANTDVLWTAGTLGTTDTGKAMYAATAPAIVAVGTSGTTYQAVIQGTNTSLEVYNPPNLADEALGMQPGTSPADAHLNTGGTEVAFQANTHVLWTYGSGGKGSSGKAMAAGTNPSITGLAQGGFEVAYQASDGNLAIYGSAGSVDTGLAMAAGTSPSIAGLAGGGYEIAYQAKPVPPAPVVTTPTPTPVPTPTPAPAKPGQHVARSLRVKIVMSWTWSHGHTRLTQLRLSRLPRRASLRLLCQGRQCPHHALTDTAAHLRRFEHRASGSRFRAGDRIYLRITAAGYHPERVLAEIRNGTVPKVRLL